MTPAHPDPAQQRANFGSAEPHVGRIGTSASFDSAGADLGLSLVPISIHCVNSTTGSVIIHPGTFRKREICRLPPRRMPKATDSSPGLAPFLLRCGKKGK